MDFPPSTAMASVTVLLDDPVQNGNDAAEARARIVAALKTVDEAEQQVSAFFLT